MSIRNRVWQIVEVAKPGDTASRAFDVAILTLIFLNVLAAILGTVPSIEAAAGAFLSWFEAVSVAIFTLEYVARVWACTSDERYARPMLGRLRFVVTGMLLIDLLVILPSYLPLLGLDLRSLRVLRLMRLLRIAKVARYYSALRLIKRVFIAKKEELILTSAILALLLVIASSVLYYCEYLEQPEAFSSIPATMWWAIATLTTVGYGDIYPQTGLGRLFASIIAVLGIGMFALPTGILGAGFVEEIQKSKQPVEHCPHCGWPLG